MMRQPQQRQRHTRNMNSSDLFPAQMLMLMCLLLFHNIHEQIEPNASKQRFNQIDGKNMSKSDKCMQDMRVNGFYYKRTLCSLFVPHKLVDYYVQTSATTTPTPYPCTTRRRPRRRRGFSRKYKVSAFYGRARCIAHTFGGFFAYYYVTLRSPHTALTHTHS